MPPRKRNWRPGAYYHVIMRGNNRANVYNDDQDKYHLMRCLADAHERFRFRILAYCVMSNHYHILITSDDELSKIMGLINRRYSDYYSKRYRHVGRIYQRRYYAKAVNTPASLLIVSRYIHRNPIETRIPMVKELTDYQHSSFNFYASPDQPMPDYLDTERLLDCLPTSYDRNANGYCLYCLQELGEQDEEEMVVWMKEMT